MGLWRNDAALVVMAVASPKFPTMSVSRKASRSFYPLEIEPANSDIGSTSDLLCTLLVQGA